MVRQKHSFWFQQNNLIAYRVHNRLITVHYLKPEGSWWSSILEICCNYPQFTQKVLTFVFSLTYNHNRISVWPFNKQYFFLSTTLKTLSMKDIDLSKDRNQGWSSPFDVLLHHAEHHKQKESSIFKQSSIAWELRKFEGWSWEPNL